MLATDNNATSTNAPLQFKISVQAINAQPGKARTGPDTPTPGTARSAAHLRPQHRHLTFVQPLAAPRPLLRRQLVPTDIRRRPGAPLAHKPPKRHRQRPVEQAVGVAPQLTPLHSHQPLQAHHCQHQRAWFPGRFNITGRDSQ
jgi:hypothetical protein